MIDQSRSVRTLGSPDSRGQRGACSVDRRHDWRLPRQPEAAASVKEHLQRRLRPSRSDVPHPCREQGDLVRHGQPHRAHRERAGAVRLVIEPIFGVSSRPPAACSVRRCCRMLNPHRDDAGRKAEHRWTAETKGSPRQRDRMLLAAIATALVDGHRAGCHGMVLNMSAGVQLQ